MILHLPLVEKRERTMKEKENGRKTVRNDSVRKFAARVIENG